MGRPVKAFLSAQPLSHIRLAYRAGLNVLTWVCILINDGWEITKAGVARTKFLISAFSARGNCEKTDTLQILRLVLVPVYLILKFPLLRLKHSQTWIWKQLRKYGCHNASVRKDKVDWTKSSSKRCVGLQWLQPARLTGWTSTTWPSSAEASAQHLGRAQLAVISANAWIEHDFICILLKNIRICWRKTYSAI